MNNYYINTSDKRVHDKEQKNPSIFLAGPTRRGSCFEESWRYKACEILHNLHFDGTIYVPEYPRQTPWDDANIERQTEWEWEALELATTICFWIPRDKDEMIGLTTNVEFGRYITMKPDSIVLGCPEDAFRMRYLKMLYKSVTNKEPANTLADTLALAVANATGYEDTF